MPTIPKNNVCRQNVRKGKSIDKDVIVQPQVWRYSYFAVPGLDWRTLNRSEDRQRVLRVSDINRRADSKIQRNCVAGRVCFTETAAGLQRRETSNGTRPSLGSNRFYAAENHVRRV